MKLLIFLAVIKSGICANILGYFITPSISHQVVFQPIWKELSLRGHNVTVVTPNPLNDPSLINLTEIDVGITYDYLEKTEAQKLVDDVLFPDQFWKLAHLSICPILFEAQVQHPEVKKLIKSTELHFDLVLVEMIWPPVYGLAAKYGSPMVGILSMSDTPLADGPVGNPAHPVLYPDGFLGFGKKLSFLERLFSIIVSVRYYLRYDYEMMPELDKIARKYFGNDIPYLGDIEKNVSLILTPHNFITSKPKPTVPALIEIGNVHLKKNVKLPQDLQEQLDKEKNGMIYFSLGSNVKSANISEKLRNTIISAFSEIPYKVLWKWETDYLPGKPDNVITRKWLPQEAVLGHPNVKVFITQGGLQSMEEAIYYKKPLVGMPFFADQMKNVRSIKEYGIGVEIDIHTVTKEQLKSAILEVFHNKTYQEKISELADIIWDHPMSGLDTAIWWIEYVIRHKGAKHLRSPLLDIPLYQYLCLDVIAFVLGVIIFSVALLYYAYKYFKSIISRKVSKTKMKAS